MTLNYKEALLHSLQLIKKLQNLLDVSSTWVLFKIYNGGGGGLSGLECLHSTSEVTGSNLGLGASCWKVGSYLPMPGGLQYSILTN